MTIPPYRFNLINSLRDRARIDKNTVVLRKVVTTIYFDVIIVFNNNVVLRKVTTTIYYDVITVVNDIVMLRKIMTTIY